MADKVIIIGGGIAGLACAWRLRSAGCPIELLEAAGQAGGNIRTEMIDGFRIERGPHTFLPSSDDIFSLATEVGLESEIVVSNKSAKKRFIVRDGKLHKVFSGPGSFVASRLLSLRGKLKLIGEPFRTKLRGAPDESAATFFERRFGPEAARILAGAFISGVYAGNPEKLSAKAAFSLFWGFEQETGSMIRGALRLRKQRKAERRAKGLPKLKRPKGLCSFKEGLGQLSSRLEAMLGAHCHTNSEVRKIEYRDHNFVVKTDSAEFSSSRVVLATPPQAAAEVLRDLDSSLADSFSEIPMAPMAVVHMGHAQKASQIPDGFGFLAPRNQGVRTLGVLFPARLFNGRTPAGGDLLTGFVGGMLDNQVLDLDDQALLGIVKNDLELLTGFSAPPDFVKVARYSAAIPQLTLGHLERLQNINTRRQKFTGLYFAGNYLRGVGMKDAVASGFEAAAEVSASFEKGIPTC
ncbi:MAG: protoporphyrinogen oxidase [Deltaproteobacteria bacterium]|nr:protoporphyrinogen oxidase [Deltaproteobacteria bacterium]